MEVFQTDNYYIFVKREKSLWWNRATSEFTLKAGKTQKLSAIISVRGKNLNVNARQNFCDNSKNISININTKQLNLIKY